MSLRQHGPGRAWPDAHNPRESLPPGGGIALPELPAARHFAKAAVDDRLTVSVR
jgi:hypothetical protein